MEEIVVHRATVRPFEPAILDLCSGDSALKSWRNTDGLVSIGG